MSSTQLETDRDCPKCGAADALYVEPNCVHGGATDITRGVACTECSYYEVADEPSAATRRARDRLARQQQRGRVDTT